MLHNRQAPPGRDFHNEVGVLGHEYAWRELARRGEERVLVRGGARSYNNESLEYDFG